MQLALQFRAAPVVCAGARATEAALVEEVRALMDAARRDPRLLARPVRVVVPSRALRLHLSTVLAREVGPALAGLKVQTLHGLALDLLAAAGQAEPAAGVMDEVYALRLGKDQESLAPLLGRYENAGQLVVDAVRQLLDAGFVAAHLPAAVEAVEAAPDLSPEERARAVAALRAAAGTDRVLDELRLDSPPRVLRRAAALVARGQTVDSRALLVHGFADATGVATDLLEALGRLADTRLFVDLPPDPAETRLLDGANRYGARLRERLGVASAPSRWTPPADLAVFQANGNQGEALEVARRVAALIDAGVAPEGIGIVARDLPRRAAALRRHLGRLGVPWSGVDLTAPPTPEARWASVVDLLRLQDRLPAERWLDLVGALDDRELTPTERADLRLALRAAGAGRLHQVERLDVSALLGRDTDLALPGAKGLEGGRVTSRRLAGDRVRAALRSARALVAHLRDAPSRAPRPVWSAWLRALFELHLQVDAPPLRAALESFDTLPAVELEGDEVQLVLERGLEDAGRGPVGGKGGGVQLLTSREARGRTFSHLFLLGNVRQGAHATRDALLGDPVRAALRVVLPDLPLRRDRFDEDRLLFAWFLSAAPKVTLSWPATDDRNKAVSVSPLVERLRWAGRWSTAVLAERTWPAVPPARSAVDDVAISAVVGADGDVLAEVLPEVVAAARPSELESAPTPGRVAAARQAVLAEKDQQGARPGPYFGALGPPGPGDPRSGVPYVSFLERYAACPWRAFVERYLGVEPAHDPLDAVPAADQRLVGATVHAVLERVARAQLPPGRRTLAELADAEGVRLRWPDPPALLALAEAAAADVLAEEGIRMAGLAQLLARGVLPMLEVVQTLDASAYVAGVEVDGRVRVGERVVGFRADRVDTHFEGGMTLTDFKTGSPFIKSLKAETARTQHLTEVRSGRKLQAAAYANAEGVEGASGRLLFLKPDVDDARRTASLGRERSEAALQDVLSTLLEALDAGVFFPRLVQTKEDAEPHACSRCSVSEACLRGDSGDRIRLRAFAPGQGRAFAALWRLPDATEGGKDDGG